MILPGKYDLIVIGGGTAGSSVMHKAAAKGWKTAIIEADSLGGTCVNVGCIPSKALIKSARVLRQVQDAAEFGVHTGTPRVDWDYIIKRKDQLVGAMRDGGYRGVQKNKNITLIEGEASFAGPGRIVVNGQTVSAQRVVIAAGARPALPRVKGLEETAFLTSTTIMELEKLPESLLIIGGGIIALEFSQLFARLGVEVTILQQNDRLVPQVEEDIAAAVEKILKNEGIKVVTGARVAAIGREGSSIFALEDSSGRKLYYRAEKLLVAAGRTPNSDRLNLETAGVKVDDQGYIKVDSAFRTGAENTWAVGDIIGGPMFTHKAWHDGFLLAGHLVEGEEINSEGRLVPFAIFTDPEIAGVGLAEREAAAAGLEISIQRYNFSDHGRSMVDGKLSGFIKLISSKSSGKLLGAHIIGSEAAELLHELIAAIRFGATLNDLQDMMHIHPTLAEAVNSASMQ